VWRRSGFEAAPGIEAIRSCLRSNKGGVGPIIEIHSERGHFPKELTLPSIGDVHRCHWI
jgi:hypothetical protein